MRDSLRSAARRDRRFPNPDAVERAFPSELDERLNDHGKKLLQAQSALQGLPEAQRKESVCFPQGDLSPRPHSLRRAVDGRKRPIFYFMPLADMFIKGQRGCTAKSPAGFAGVPA